MNTTPDSLLVQMALSSLRANGVVVGETQLKFLKHKDSRSDVEISNHVNGLANALVVALGKHGNVEVIVYPKSYDILVNGTVVMSYRRHWLLARYVYECSHFYTFEVNTVRMGEALGDFLNIFFGDRKPA